MNPGPIGRSGLSDEGADAAFARADLDEAEAGPPPLRQKSTDGESTSR